MCDGSKRLAQGLQRSQVHSLVHAVCSVSWKRAVVPTAFSLATLAMRGGDAHAAASSSGGPPQYTQRVQGVLSHLEQHPMQLTSGSMMYYEPDQELHTPLPDVVQGLRPEDVGEVRPQATLMHGMHGLECMAH